MKVKDVLVSALNVLGRRALAESLAAGTVSDAEETDTVNTLLYCFNAVEDELARKYLPLNAKEKLVSYNGEFYYSKFAHAPVRIKRVTSGGKDVEYELNPQYIAATVREITVEYDYVPAKKTLESESDFGAGVSERLFVLGIAAEYCLINGEIEAAELWENKYRTQIDVAQSSLPSGGYIPPRRWV